MSRFRGCRGLTITTITLLSLLGAVGCAPPGELQSGEGATPAGQQQIPFHEGSGRPSPTGNPSTAQDRSNDARPETDLPFHDPQNLPAGTLLTVRLKGPISAEHADATAIFEAVVDQPILIEGNQLVPVGATVSGRVESARASNLKRNRGYLRLTLASIHLAGVDSPLQTSSLFVGGNAGQTQAPQSPVLDGQTSATVVRLEKGRRLVFRLTQPVYVAASRQAPASH
jgi:hypothetical protein